MSHGKPASSALPRPSVVPEWSVAVAALATGYGAAMLLRDAPPSIGQAIMPSVFALMFGTGARQVWELRSGATL